MFKHIIIILLCNEATISIKLNLTYGEIRWANACFGFEDKKFNLCLVGSLIIAFEL